MDLAAAGPNLETLSVICPGESTTVLPALLGMKKLCPKLIEFTFGCAHLDDPIDFLNL